MLYMCPMGHLRKTPYMGTCGQCRRNETKRLERRKEKHAPPQFKRKPK